MIQEISVYHWNREKNEYLKKERNISFELIVEALQQGKMLVKYPHPNQKRYSGQWIYVININEYAYVVPFIQTGSVYFLKTIIASRKATRLHIKHKKEDV